MPWCPSTVSMFSLSLTHVGVCSLHLDPSNGQPLHQPFGPCTCLRGVRLESLAVSNRPADEVPERVTLHLWGVRPSRVPAAVVRMGLDRRQLRPSAGLRFAKLLGTGHGRSFTIRDADVLHWGLLATWSCAASAAAFESGP